MKISYFLFVLVISVFFACTKDISLAQPGYTEKPSIQGILEPDSLPVVYLNRTTPFLSAPTTPADVIIRDATVKITGPDTADLLSLDSTYDWIRCRYEYYYKGSIVTAWNTPYTLEITWNGAVYTASTQTKLSRPVLDSVSYTQKFNDVYGEHEGVIVYFTDQPGEKNFYRYEQFREVDTTMRHASIPLNLNNCIGTDTIMVLEQGRSVYNDENADGQSIKLVIEPAFTHRADQQTTVRVQSIDEAMYAFYNQADQQKLAQYNPFVEPIFLRPGQFGSKAWGFFGCRVRSNPLPFVFPE